VLLFAAAAEAQQAQPQRPYRGLFGQRDHDPNGRQPIDFTMSLNEGYDSAGVDQLGTNSLGVRRAGLYSNLDTALRITRGRRDRRLTVTAGDALRYYPGPGSPLWQSAHLAMSQGVGYTSYYQFELFPALSLGGDQMPKGPSSDYAVGNQPAYTYTSAIQFDQKLNTRSELRLQYDRQSVMFSVPGSDLRTQSGGIRLTHHLNRYSGFHAGIIARDAQYGLSGDVNQIHSYDIDVGLEYDRPISFSRRTTLRFSSGSSLVPQAGRMYYRVTGNASLTHQIARTWTASLRYDRALQFVQALPQPFFSDSITAGMRGNPSRRVDLSFSGGYSAGAIGVSAEGGALGTYTGSAQIGMSLNRHSALYSEYLYYHYRFGRQTFAAAFPGLLDRQTARIGLKLWFPLHD
jgi:hypothetical protein